MSEKLTNKIVVMGDTHGDFGKLNTFINKKQPAIILQCGDFGYWPRIVRRTYNGKYEVKEEVKAQDTKIYWCDGNHEDHESLRLLKDNEIWSNVFYMKRGSLLTLPDGRTVLFMGGADSIDKAQRRQGYDWFPEELISYADINNLPDPNTKIDIVISHTCPTEFYMKGSEWFVEKVPDPSRKALSHILQVYQPKLWYFGHWHYYQTGYVLGCRWTALDMSWNSQYWEVLKGDENVVIS